MLLDCFRQVLGYWYIRRFFALVGIVFLLGSDRTFHMHIDVGEYVL